MTSRSVFRRIGFAVLCIASISAGSALAIREWRTERVEALTLAAEIAASVDARETATAERLAWFFLDTNRRLDGETALYMAYAVQEASNRYDLPEAILAGLIHTESRADPKAVNKGCFGLTQVHWSVWAKTLTKSHPEIFRKEDLFEPRRSILAGAWILRHYLDRYGHMDRALEAYSGGAKWYPAKVQRAACSL
jgi:soluble lytic murein transglycosylase-like protein